MSLIDLLPEYYKSSPETAALQSAVGTEVDCAGEAKQDLLLQLNVDTATWGLGLWEKAYGISPAASDLPNIRRARIKSKMRTRGATTASMIQNIAKSFINGMAGVIEHPEKYAIEIQFDATQQIPSNLAGLTEAIDEIKPAHLAYAYAYLFISQAMAGAYQTSGITLTIYPYTAGSLKAAAKINTGSCYFAANEILIQPKGSEV